ncbi:MAG: MarR family transcriptional regulator [Corallococcus sp.]|nr:MarR family transcriptional regulator [Corallococcus sp.]MCM1358943.1 MarR family transcriptional regulator [Corallococcus sp.]MCM1394931.1 MarR family transcriptional regulator [Corallococcus sp.]
MSRTIADLTDLIITYYPKMRKVFRKLVSIKDVPITVTQLTCLSIIEKHGKLTMSDLANELSMSNQQLTKVVDALVEFELVERYYDDDNRRKVFAKTTEKGKQTLTALNEELSKKLNWMSRKFSDDEIDKLYDCFAHIASYFGYKED